MSKKAFAYFGSVAISVLASGFLVLLLAASTGTHPVASNRIMREIDSSQIAAVKGTAHPLARPQFDRGRLSPEKQLGNVAITFRLSAPQQADLNQLLREQQDRSSPNYHRWLTPEQYAQRFGMSQSDLAKVSSWLQSQGLTVTGVSRNRREISFTGSVGQIEYALKTELHNYSINGEEHFANATDVSLPAAFSADVLGVRGLNSFYPKPKYVRKASPRFTSNASGNHFLIPGDFATIYDLPAAWDGAGQTIAVIGQTLISTADIDNFRSASGLPARTAGNFQQIQVPGTGTAQKCTGGDETEADLDLEWSEGIAKNATIKFVYAGVGVGGNCNNRTKNAFDALFYAVDNNVAPIISISYGNCEANLGKQNVLTMQGWAQEANAQGQTISGPAGDTGAADCDSGASATNGLAVDVPASIPEVTGVGGSEFTGDATQCAGNPPSCPGNVAPSDSPYWSGTSASNSGPTAQQYIPEKSWNDTTAAIAQGGNLDGTGGGASTIFSKPSWQSGTGVPNDAVRDVPDIALNASNFHDAYLFCSEDFYTGQSSTAVSCGSGFRTTDTNTNPQTTDNNALTAVGGTSAGAPTFAGILALINQATASTGLGNVNPMLYSLAASSPNAFHDITSGDNKVPCTSGTKNCPAGTTSIGFTTNAGYDPVTGLGSLDVANLITAWTAAIVNPNGDFTIGGTATSVGAAGQTGTSTITVTGLNGFNGAVDLACASSSTQVSCSLSPTSVDLSTSSTQTSTLTLTSVADLRLPSGRHPRGLWFATSSGIFAIAILGGISFSERRKWAAISALALVAIALTAVGCGGSGTKTSVQQNQGPQTFTVTVTGTGTNSSSTALSHSTTVNFTVQ